MIGRLVGFVRSWIVYRRPGRLRGLRRLYRPFVEPGDLVFDVGAHLGDRTAAFASLGARVVAFEPQPEFARWMRRLEGSTEGVVVRECAVGPEPGTARLAVSARHPTLATLAHDWRERVGRENPTFSHVEWDDTIEVPVTTLAAAIDEFGVPAFCKIDVEGFEADVLAGLDRPVPALSLEFVAGTLDVARRCVERLEVLGRWEYQVVLGEGRRFHLDDWTGAREILRWFDAGADGASSGDLYARFRAEPSDRADSASAPDAP